MICVYGLLFIVGLYFWQLGELHYWGYNVIICVKLFIEYCVLVLLLGEGFFVGLILLYDFVEVVLMCCVGWGVWIVYDFLGFYEELLFNLFDELKCDC